MADETAKIQILDIPNLVQSFIENHFSKVKDMGYNTSDPYYQNLLKDPIRNYFKISNNTSFFVGAGVTELFRTLLYIFNTGRVIGVAHQFTPFIDYLKIVGNDYTAVQNSDFSFPLEELLNKIDNTPNCSFVILERPMKFSGDCCSLLDLSRILSGALHHGLYVLVDESYANYIPLEESSIKLLDFFHNLIVLRSNAKAFNLGGIRTGILFTSSLDMTQKLRYYCRPYSPDIFSVNFFAYHLKMGRDLINKLIIFTDELKRKVMFGLSSRGYQYLPTHRSVPIICIYNKSFDVNQYFEDAFVKTSNYNYNVSINGHSLCRIRIPYNVDVLNQFVRIL